MTNNFRSILRRLQPSSQHHRHTGHITNSRHRRQAIQVMLQGGMVQFIIGNKKGGVGGIFFDIDNLSAVDLVIRAKSTPQKVRHSMFALMTPHDYFYQITKLDYPVDLDRLSAHPCFIRVPVKYPQAFPAHAISQSHLGHHLVQTFPSDLVPHFKEFVREAAQSGVRVGGTSLNYTGQGNLTQIEDIARFFISSPGQKYWLDTPAKFTGVSWTIIELHPQKPDLVPHREGNSPFTAIAEALFGLNK